MNDDEFREWALRELPGEDLDRLLAEKDAEIAALRARLGARKTHPKCACGNPGLYLCDALIPDRRERALRRLRGEDERCSKPLCSTCRRQRGGLIFYCYRGGRLETDTLDYCAEHEGAP